MSRMVQRDVVISGIGLVSCLGVGLDAHRDALRAPPGAPVVDTQRFAPFPVHPLPEIDWGQQIPKRGDQRQMENWQRLGVYAAGLALDDAGVKGDADFCGTMDMIVAAGGGERDVEVDTAIMKMADQPDAGPAINEKLINDLRPTLFLAQLSNLLAGNISIVHGVTGSSRTFMGEESAGISALQTAVARLRSGQSTHVLVGAATHAEHPDFLLNYELGGHLHRGDWRPVWDRGTSEGGGVVAGGGGAFLVLETREHAEARGRKPYAVLDRVVSDRLRRGDSHAKGLGALVEAAGAADRAFVVSGASGSPAATQAERAALGDRPVRGQCSLIGHLREVQMPFAVALAALAVADGIAAAPFTPDERPAGGPVDAVLATTVGFLRGDGAALVSKA